MKKEKKERENSTLIPIRGVMLKKLKVNRDYRGNFIEVIRDDWKLLKKIRQISISKTMPGIIKAFHMHKKQNEAWILLEGKVKIGLCDLRKKSTTNNKKVSMIMDSNKDPLVLLLPKGVAHGYKVIGKKPCKMLYITDNVYNTKIPDEIRIPHNDLSIGFKW